MHIFRCNLKQNIIVNYIFLSQVSRQVSQCSCPRRFQVEQISANRYRVRAKSYNVQQKYCTCSEGACLCFFFQFGDSQQLRMVRILRSTLMVRVGGGWTALDEFLVKNDPCRGNSKYYLISKYYMPYLEIQTTENVFCLLVKGRTNLKIKQKYLSPQSLDVSGRRGSKGLAVSRSNSSLSLYSSASAPSSPLTRQVSYNLVLSQTCFDFYCAHYPNATSLLHDPLRVAVLWSHQKLCILKI